MAGWATELFKSVSGWRLCESLSSAAWRDVVRCKTRSSGHSRLSAVPDLTHLLTQPLKSNFTLNSSFFLRGSGFHTERSFCSEQKQSLNFYRESARLETFKSYIKLQFLLNLKTPLSNNTFKKTAFIKINNSLIFSVFLVCSGDGVIL